MLAAIAFTFLAAAIIKIMTYISVLDIRRSDADNLKQVTQAVQYYAELNKDALIANKQIIGITNPNKPKLEELKNLNYLTSEGANIHPFGSSYQTQVTAKPNGSIEGFVYLATPIVDSEGKPDHRRACEIARQIGQNGFCSDFSSPTKIGNGSVFYDNPGGSIPASVVGYIFVPA